MYINLIWGSDTSAMPSKEIAAIEYAASFLDNWISNPITLNIQVGYNEVGGHAMDDVGEGRFNSIHESYNALAPLLSAHNGGAQLPASDPTNGQGIYVANAEAKALGLMPANATGIDGYIGFAHDSLFNFNPFHRARPNKQDFTGIAIHELTEAMGRRSDGFSPIGSTDVLDLYRYDSPGSLGSNGTANYFSTDGGVTNLGNFNTAPDADPGDWNLKGRKDVFRTDVPLDKLNPLTSRDGLLMQALGFAPASIMQEANGTVEELQNGSFISLSKVSPGWRLAGLGDFGGTDNTDILFQSKDGRLKDWTVQGTNVVNVAQLDGHVSPSLHVVGIADLTGSGQANDILFQNDSGSVFEWQMSGDKVVASGSVGGNISGFHIVGIQGNDVHFLNPSTGSTWDWVVSGFNVTNSGHLS